MCHREREGASAFRAFMSDERGAVTTDWVVVTAAVLLGAAAFSATVGGGAARIGTAFALPLAPVEFPTE